MRVLWRSSAEINSINRIAHIVDCDGDKFLEVYTPRVSVWKRIKQGIIYILKGTPIIFSSIILDGSLRIGSEDNGR